MMSDEFFHHPQTITSLLKTHQILLPAPRY
jgi:hypothetical protein